MGYFLSEEKRGLIRDLRMGNKVLTAGIGYTIGNYLIRGIAFLSLPIFARIMSTSDFGIYNTFVAYETILIQIIALELHTSFKRARFNYKLEKEQRSDPLFYEEYASVALFIIFLNAAILSLAAIIFRNYLYILFEMDLLVFIMMILCSLGNAVMLCFNADRALSYNYKDYIKIGVINAVGSVVLSIVLIETVFSKERYMGRIVGSTVIFVLLSLFVLILFFHRTVPGHYREYLRWGLPYSLPIVPHGLSQVILGQFDKIMIRHIVGASAAGIYSFAYNVFMIIYVTYRSLDTVWSQWFFEQMEKEDLQAIRHYSALYMLLMLSMSIIVMLLSPELILILGSSKYSSAIYCVLPIVAGGYFAFLYSIPCQVEYYREKTQYIGIGSGAAAIANVLLNIIFIPKFGYVAAAYTTLVTYVLYFAFHYFIAWRIERKNLFSNKVVALCSVAVVLMMGVSFLLIDLRIVRWLIAALFIAVAAFYEERNIGYIKKKF